MMNVQAISDLHGFLPDIGPCDLLLLAGDYCPKRNLELQHRWLQNDFRKWLEKTEARYIVGIAGNHDFIFEQSPELVEDLPWIYLQDEMVNIEGIRIYGTPWTPEFGNWAFMRKEDVLRSYFSQIPAGIDILLSHGPAKKYLDKTIYGDDAGSYELRNRIQIVKPDSVVCGHIHEARGVIEEGPIRYYNVAHVNVKYEPVYGPVHIPLRAD